MFWSRLNDGRNSSLIIPQLENIFQFLQLVARENDDESITKNCIGLIGDLAVLLMQHAGEALILRQYIYAFKNGVYTAKTVGGSIFPAADGQRYDFRGFARR